ncbi:polysaccharide deacetylase family protein [Paenibacillus sacheonensis]|uniref:Polysaccharide deacetylase family protein n=1 Tax=Paenibacillus sacheonensis TaxID=742054 RepID=A0A7X5BYR8_9BACL|nr:polysaccharide deacetylase family protein [Paenibacillus sacheonensis]MBM7564222.1 peptidoglycan/xylan/chitin deacetylase (PgdA/CDA1 family) [Paenibacillus sacheonensis]NBC67455.1 polysaccharide deacetylase family protein [Paenibacillus sacheonensis]
MSETIHSVQTSSKAIAITFDDGPNTLYTRQTADLFNAVSGKATFFIVGEKIESHADFIREIHDEGHEIGNHTFSHPFLTQISEEEAFEEIDRTDKLIEQVIGRRTAVFRAPYLDSNEATLALADRFGYSSIGALNLDTRDWETPGVDYILDHTWDHIRDGAILLFHDGAGDRSQTMEAIRILLDKLTSQGYELVTVSELLSRQDN